MAAASCSSSFRSADRVISPGGSGFLLFMGVRGFPFYSSKSENFLGALTLGAIWTLSKAFVKRSTLCYSCTRYFELVRRTRWMLAGSCCSENCYCCAICNSSCATTAVSII